LKENAVNFIKNFLYTVTSNLLSLLVSAIVILFVPKLVGVEQYGYWQLYLFYTSYIGFLHFGWNDGIYLRLGGKDYDKLNKGLYFSQYYMLMVLQVCLGIFLIIMGYVFDVSPQKLLIIQATSLCMIIVNTRYMILYILQATNRIKPYAQITIVDRIVYVSLIILLLLLRKCEYQLLIAADLFGKGISLILAMYICKDIVFRPFRDLIFNFSEVFLNIQAGIKLMFSNIAGKFIIGFVKMGIEFSWDIVTFGKISLTLSVSNLVMLFIGAIGTIMYPVLRKINENSLSEIYVMGKTLLTAFLYALLFLYYPMKVMLSAWLPEYSEGLMYMGILFPIIIYEGKMSLLVNTYFKTLRRENLMLLVNIISLIVSGILTLILTIFFKSLVLSMVAIVFLHAFRCTVSECFLSKILKVRIIKDVIIDCLLTILFIMLFWNIDSISALAIYSVGYLLFFVFKRREIYLSFYSLYNLVKN